MLFSILAGFCLWSLNYFLFREIIFQLYPSLYLYSVLLCFFYTKNIFKPYGFCSITQLDLLVLPQSRLLELSVILTFLVFCVQTISLQHLQHCILICFFFFSFIQDCNLCLTAFHYSELQGMRMLYHKWLEAFSKLDFELTEFISSCMLRLPFFLSLQKACLYLWCIPN